MGMSSTLIGGLCQGITSNHHSSVGLMPFVHHSCSGRKNPPRLRSVWVSQGKENQLLFTHCTIQCTHKNSNHRRLLLKLEMLCRRSLFLTSPSFVVVFFFLRESEEAYTYKLMLTCHVAHKYFTVSQESFNSL